MLPGAAPGPGPGVLGSAPSPTPLIYRQKRNHLHIVFFLLVSVEVPLPFTLWSTSNPTATLETACWGGGQGGAVWGVQADEHWASQSPRSGASWTRSCESPTLRQSKPGVAARFAERLVSVFSFLHHSLFIKDCQSKVHEMQQEKPPPCLSAFPQGSIPEGGGELQGSNVSPPAPVVSCPCGLPAPVVCLHL